MGISPSTTGSVLRTTAGVREDRAGSHVVNYRSRFGREADFVLICKMADRKEHKNHNEARSDYAIYRIFLDALLFKYGKADAQRVTLSSGLPTRIHQQIRKWVALGYDVTFEIIVILKNATTRQAKLEEQNQIKKHEQENGSKPPGNQN